MKRPRVLDDTSLFDDILNETPQEDKNFIANSLNIAHQIIALMEQKNLRQRDLATLMSKTEAEISRMLSGTHNLTIKTISKIEAVLDAKIITTPRNVEIEHMDMVESINVVTTAGNRSGIMANVWTGTAIGEHSSALAA